MKLTGSTTEADLMVPVNQARARLAEVAADETVRPKDLVHAAHAVAAADAVARFRYHFVGVLARYDGDSRERTKAITTTLLKAAMRPADDTWSGRGNDAARAAHDALLEEIDRLYWEFTR